MQVSYAQNSDKHYVIDFCKNTFSWGDYIKDVWDYWLREGNLFVVRIGSQPLAICHAYVTKGSQCWIEGIRVHPNFRRQGFARSLILHCESVARENKCKKCLMLIEKNNTPSQNLANKMGYSKENLWQYYSLLPKPSNSFKVNIADSIKNLNFDYFVRSWRWMKLDDNILDDLIKNNKIIQSENSYGILTDSDHFSKTLIVTIYAKTTSGCSNILKFLQNFAYENGYQRIQILTLDSLSFSGLEKKLEFFLLSKRIMI